ncbi:baeRF7 domain-containing protein [Maribacter spongiicola]|uniref:baeRF7 domain-containing protein n=1 Tax=Maribacter spongiicola TaxID=1206753 RepID=UPI003F96998E
MYTAEKLPLPKSTFESLMAKKALHCVSIYLSMDKKGMQQNLHLAQAKLKNCLKEVGTVLLKYQLNQKGVEDYLEPITQLLDRVDLWRNPSDGLAIFLDPETGLQYFKVPISFETQTYVANHFYLKPLFPIYTNDGTYYLLEISRDYVKLYKASRYQFKDLFVEDFAPKRLEEAVGFDYRPKVLQFRNANNLSSAGVFHGHGEGKDDDKNEMVKFFRALDKGLKKAIENQNAPLLLACTDYLYSIYKETSTYKNVYDGHLGGDPEFKVKTSLHQDSWELIEPYFKILESEMIQKFKDLSYSQKTSYEIGEILRATFQGTVEVLFVENESDVFGTFNLKTNRVTVEKSKDISNTSLTNLAALECYKRGGKVFLLHAEHMPMKNSNLNAIFRY